MKAWLCTAALVSIWPVVQAQVIQWDVEHRQVGPDLTRRSATFEEVITNKKRKGGYFATAEVGSPGQNVTLLLDTGSSDIWVPWSNASICDNSGCSLGSFDPDESSSFEDIGSNLFSITYVDNSYSKGDYFEDDFDLGGATISNLTMGLGVRTNIAYGLIGVGYAINEVSVDTADATYPNLPIAMYQAGHINSIAYSLWLNDLSANTGSILFGGIDTKKYIGNMSRLNVQPDNNSYVHFTVAMTSLDASSSSGSDALTSDHFPVGAVLDSGTTLSYLPNDLTAQIWEEVGAYYDAKFGLAVLPCSYSKHEGNFTFGFGGSDGPQISVAMDELVMDLTNGSPPEFTSGTYKGELVCEFGIQNYSSDVYLLGTTFLRSAYVVYDLVNNEIGLAQTDFNSTETNIVAFKSKGATIPSATAAPNQNQTSNGSTATETGLSAADGFQGDDDDDDDSDNAASSLTPCSPSLVVVGMTVVFMLVGGGGFSSNLP
ncbi:hypothetical protein QQZ08_009849 [Neonectria magnoliae]|uniref:Peptidase A1 domain-containing protein n=1 Tax=Neonectria magnoliae TaxID=2732573 RepID=A0ABR1HKG7_9HYPO